LRVITCCPQLGPGLRRGTASRSRPHSLHRAPVPSHRKNKVVHPAETFRAGRAYLRRLIDEGEQAMKNAVPLFLALIPLLAVIGACVAVP